MRGENYYLLLTLKSGEVFRVYSKPITLKMMDERTTRYENKDELVRTIIANTKASFTPKDVASVSIVMQPNKKKEEYKIEKGPLYKKDRGVLNIESVAARFELLAMDKIFVRKFAKRYKGIRNLNTLATEIEGALNTGESYMDSLICLSEKVFSTYKGIRNTYLVIRQYEFESKRNDRRKQDEVLISDVSKDEYEEMRLEYLKEYERELLDIEDFYGKEELSPFDGNKSK